MTAPPDLRDPVQRAAYRVELRGIGRSLRRAGLAFALLGLVLAVARALWLPAMPALIALAPIALGALNMLAAVALRVRYHQGRMKREG